MIKYYARDLKDTGHLYKYDTETDRFYFMDHCWTGEGVWFVRGFGMPDYLVEITEEQAMEISRGSLYTSKTHGIDV